MRNLLSPEIDKFRLRTEHILKTYGSFGDANNGIFVFPNLQRGRLTVIASVGGGWEHVSVSHINRVPTWSEMEYIKHIFFNDDETCMQLHVPINKHINVHNNCLHIWRPTLQLIPIPPKEFV